MSHVQGKIVDIFCVYNKTISSGMQNPLEEIMQAQIGRFATPYASSNYIYLEHSYFWLQVEQNTHDFNDNIGIMHDQNNWNELIRSLWSS